MRSSPFVPGARPSKASDASTFVCSRTALPSMAGKAGSAALERRADAAEAATVAIEDEDESQRDLHAPII